MCTDGGRGGGGHLFHIFFFTTNYNYKIVISKTLSFDTEKKKKSEHPFHITVCEPTSSHDLSRGSPKHFLWCVGHVQKAVNVLLIPVNLSYGGRHGGQGLVVHQQVKRLVRVEWHPIPAQKGGDLFSVTLWERERERVCVCVYEVTQVGYVGNELIAIDVVWGELGTGLSFRFWR